MIATIMRFNVVLTTNFDDLLEQAFEIARNPLTVFEVHLNSDLPPFSALAGHRSLIKMHGNLYSLRVDYTLDALPTETDRRRFVEYLRSTTQSSPFLAPAAPDEIFSHRNHLLLLGVSAAERRTRDFIKHAWNHLGPDFKVFWLCHTERDVHNVQTFAKEFQEQSRDDRFISKDWDGAHILRYPYLGLFFLQLYQTIRRGIPTTGIIFPSASRAAVPPLPGFETAEPPKSFSTFAQRIRSRLEELQSDTFHQHRLIVVSSNTASAGVTSVCASVFDDIQEDHQIAIWLDMNDTSSTDDLFEQLLDAVCYRIGVENWMPVHVEKRPESRANEIRKIASAINAKWVIFLNARETPGTNLADGMEILNDSAHPNNWLDSASEERIAAATRRNDDDSDNLATFVEFISHLCFAVENDKSVPGSLSMSVILLCRRTPPDKPSPLEETLVSVHHIAEAALPDSPCTNFDEISVIYDTFKWLVAKTDEIHAVHHFFIYCFFFSACVTLATIWCPSVSSNTGEFSAVRRKIKCCFYGWKNLNRRAWFEESRVASFGFTHGLGHGCGSDSANKLSDKSLLH